MQSAKLKWTRDGDQRTARGKLAEYRITEWVTGSGSTWALAVKSAANGIITDGGGYHTLQLAKDAAYSLDLR